MQPLAAHIPPPHGHKTQAEVESLKRSWASDPCWDLASTEGYEAYAEELALFASAQRTQWARAAADRVAARVGVFLDRHDLLTASGEIRSAKLGVVLVDLEDRLAGCEELLASYRDRLNALEQARRRAGWRS